MQNHLYTYDNIDYIERAEYDCLFVRDENSKLQMLKNLNGKQNIVQRATNFSKNLG